MKSSLAGKRVKKDPAFVNTMRYAGLLAWASKMASVVYRALPKEEKEYALFRKLTGMAMVLVKKGKTKEEVLSDLNKTVKKSVVVTPRAETIATCHFAEDILYKVFSTQFPHPADEIFCKRGSMPP